MTTILAKPNFVFAMLALFTLAACNGDGGNGTEPPATYTVGGIVAGLASGQRIVLQNGETDRFTVSANGVFTLATALVDGATYNVSVLTQPDGQTCTASSNSGTISGADISNVSVVCSNNTYSVGGTVAGLGTGESVVLQNNAGDDLTLTGNGEFAFATPVAFGAGYAVTVLNHPVGQRCTVSNGDGTVNGDVTSVAITCSINTYTVGGAVSGLRPGQRVVLQNNAGDDLALSMAGTFMFTTPVAYGSAYEVTIAIQPARQTCTVSNDTGTIGLTNVTNVSVECVNNNYSVGGTLTGLASGESVTLRNGADNLTLYTNGTFAFPSGVADLAGYNVSITNQPAAQICSVTNDSGTIDGTNVENLSVTCADAYTIGGNVNGLASGATLVLSNNGNDNKTITANGAFAFTTLLASTSAYDVTVAVQPVGQSCVVADGIGTVGTVNITSVTVSCQNIVSPLFPDNGANWNDYVGSDGRDNACIGSETGGYNACRHGGELRVYRVAGYTSCTGLIATDTLGAFDWTCDASSGDARVVSTGLKSTKNLSDLIDFTGISPSWKNNSVTVKNGTTTVVTSVPSQWWTNPFIVDNNGMTPSEMGSAGTIYVVDEISAQGIYSIGADKIGFIVKPGVTLRGSGIFSDNVVTADSRKFIWIEGRVDATGNNVGVSLLQAKFSVLRNVRVDAGYLGIYIGGSSLANKSLNNMATNITAVKNNGGIELYASSYDTLRDVTVTNNTSRGLSVSHASHDFINGVTSVNNGSDGIYFWSATDNIVSNIISTNNGEGLNVIASSYSNIFSRAIFANNDATGAYTYSQGNVLMLATSIGNGGNGYRWEGGTLIGVIAADNSSGIYVANNSVVDNATTANNGYGVRVYGSHNTFTGQWKVGNNITDCIVGTGYTDPGLVDGTCANNGTSDATLTTGITFASSFVGKLTTDDVINTSDTNGSATYPTDVAAFDWTQFENNSRVWGTQTSITVNATFLPTRRKWTYGTGYVWDWSLKTTDTVNRNMLSVPLGDNALTHTWSDGTTTTFLRNAVELSGDGDTLCESNETCLYTPNIGAYQGHGALISAGSFIDGTITGVTLMKYATNGR